MKKIRLFTSLLALGLLLPPFSRADEDPSPLRGLMHTFEREIRKLSPYLGSEQKFRSPEGRKAVAESLATIEKKAHQDKPIEIAQNPGFRITFDLLADHLRSTKKAFDRGDFEVARLRLNATTNYCMACHTQVPMPSAWGGKGADLKKMTVSNAEFLFITRRFDQALERFDQLVRGYPKTDAKEDDLSAIYRRKLALFARVQRDPSAAIANLQKDLENKKLPPTIRSNIETWISFFEQWKAEKSDPSALDTPALLTYFKKNVPEQGFRAIAPADPNLVIYLRLSGLLYERLLKEPDGVNTQEILYNLSICEKHLSPLYWYSLSDVYLFQCVMNYPHKPLTKKCFDAYQTSMLERYNTTVSGLPEDLKASLEAMKNNL